MSKPAGHVMVSVESLSAQQAYTQTASILDSLSSFPFSPADRARFILFGVGAHLAVPYACIHHAFAIHAANLPDSIAVEHFEERLTFRQLDKQSDVLAAYLRNRGICPGKRVCLLTQRSLGMVVAMLAILKSGGSYVPLDGGITPKETVRFVVEDSQSSTVLYTSSFEHLVPEAIDRMCIDQAFSDIGDETALSTTSPPDLSSSSHEAYLIYTSGTTGKPKGVSISHGNITNLLCLSPGKVGMRPGIRVAQLLNISFDMCAWEVLGSLMNGCTLCIRGRSREDWKSILRSVDVVISTPTILRDYSPHEFPRIRCVATAGEPCHQALADKWSQSTKFYNSCGPTETTIINTVHAHVTGAPLSIGSPTPNNRVYILGDDMQPLAIGQVGTMWAAGAGISAGYANRADLTRERFIMDPFVKDGTVMFNTGDLGRWTRDGKLEHFGRIDDQVKIKGFRVELDGVSAAMMSCKEVTQAVALLVNHRDLWGIVCPLSLNTRTIKQKVSEQLPYYAVPSHFLTLDRLPKTRNGKIDKSLLRDLVQKISKREDDDKRNSQVVNLQAAICMTL